MAKPSSSQQTTENKASTLSAPKIKVAPKKTSTTKSKIVAPEDVKAVPPANSKPSPNTDSKSIGVTLQQTRKAKSFDVFTVSQSLRISERYIHAIESMDRSSLPEKVYTLGFVRSYAQHLGLDPEDAVNQFKIDIYNSPRDEKGKALSVPKPVDDYRLPSPKTILFSLVAISFISAALWYGHRATKTTPEDEIASLLTSDQEHIAPYISLPEGSPEPPAQP